MRTFSMQKYAGNKCQNWPKGQIRKKKFMSQKFHVLYVQYFNRQAQTQDLESQHKESKSLYAQIKLPQLLLVCFRYGYVDSSKTYRNFYCNTSGGWEQQPSSFKWNRDVPLCQRELAFPLITNFQLSAMFMVFAQFF